MPIATALGRFSKEADTGAFQENIDGSRLSPPSVQQDGYTALTQTNYSRSKTPCVSKLAFQRKSQRSCYREFRDS